MLQADRLPRRGQRDRADDHRCQPRRSSRVMRHRSGPSSMPRLSSEEGYRGPIGMDQRVSRGLSLLVRIEDMRWCRPCRVEHHLPSAGHPPVLQSNAATFSVPIARSSAVSLVSRSLRLLASANCAPRRRSSAIRISSVEGKPTAYSAFIPASARSAAMTACVLASTSVLAAATFAQAVSDAGVAASRCGDPCWLH